MSRIIAFHTNYLSLRGTEVALYDYAHFNEEILKNRSLIITKKQSYELAAFQKFKNRFSIFFYDNISGLDSIVHKNKVDSLYMIKSGQEDGVQSKYAKNLVHAVFPTSASDIHGDKYAYVSEWLSLTCSGGSIPYVPHIVNIGLPINNFRESIGIPQNALVFGCYGGNDSFNIDFVKDSIIKSASDRFDLFFIFMNIKPFTNHHKIMFFPGSPDIEKKSAFINACDGMIHARDIGESFGLACGEFSVMNKPIITYGLSPQKSHLSILGNSALIYSNKSDLMNYFIYINKKDLNNKNWDCYSQVFSPKKVMAKFKKVFLD